MFGAIVIGPFLKRVGRNPSKTKLTDFYVAAPVTASVALTLIGYFLDILRRLVDEQNREIRSYLAYRCFLAVLLCAGMVLATYPLVRSQRWVDPSGEGKGWQCVAFVVLSNIVAVILLVTVTLFIKFG